VTRVMADEVEIEDCGMRRRTRCRKFGSERRDERWFACEHDNGF